MTKARTDLLAIAEQVTDTAALRSVSWRQSEALRRCAAACMDAANAMDDFLRLKELEQLDATQEELNRATWGAQAP